MEYVAEQGNANVQGVVEECKKIQYSPELNIDTHWIVKKVFFKCIILSS